VLCDTLNISLLDGGVGGVGVILVHPVNNNIINNFFIISF
jgi:hypothetical protein